MSKGGQGRRDDQGRCQGGSGGHDIRGVSRGGLEAGKSYEVFPAYTQWQGLHGHWSIYRRLYGLHAAERCRQGHAVDVGYGQLAWSLRTDERVVNMERNEHPQRQTGGSCRTD